MVFWKLAKSWVTVVALSGLLSACGGAEMTDESVKSTAVGTSGSSSSTHPSESSSPSAPSSSSSTSSSSGSSELSAPHHQVMLRGQVTYDRVPFSKRHNRGLDYDATYPLPVRVATVQVLDAFDRVIAATRTDEQGEYAVDVPEATDVKVRVLAETVNGQAAGWHVRVTDNTNDNAPYVLEGTLTDTGIGSQTRDLHAASGWTGNDYMAARSAAPFAILDSIYDGIRTIADVDALVVLPYLEVRWSVDNIAASGSLAEGQIGTSFYTNSGPAIYLLGKANNDADEYDHSVILHEFGHYIEHQLSRSESIGGSHSFYSKLDMRVAFGEAWGNAFAGIASGDPVYRDSLGSKQSLGFAFDVEHNHTSNRGWYSEASIQSILYNLYEGVADKIGMTNLGFAPIYDVLTDAQYKNFDGLASIYPFIELLKQAEPESASDIDLLVQGENIFGVGMYGDGETNNGESSRLLPHYTELSPGGTVNVCSDSAFGDYNGLDVHRFVRLQIPSAKTYRLQIKASGGRLSATNPNFYFYQKGKLLFSGTANTVDSEVASRHLEAGVYIMDVFEKSNADRIDKNGGLACFDVSVN